MNTYTLKKNFISLATIAALSGSILIAADFHVTTLSDENDNNCTNISSLSLRDAIYCSANGDTILFDVDGTFDLSGGSQILVDKNITISGNGINSTQFNMYGNRYFDIPASGVVSMSDMTFFGTYNYAIRNSGDLNLSKSRLENISTSVSGAARIYNDGTMTIERTSISGNSVSDTNGGAINNIGTLTITDSILSNNSASVSCGTANGGAVYNDGSITISRTTLSDNSTFSTYGGAIYNDSGSSMSIIDSNLTSNYSNYSGGAIYNNNSSLNVERSNLSNNTANNGGAIYSSASQLSIQNSSLYDNNSSISGGAIYANSSSTNLFNSTISGNQVYEDGGGIYISSGDVNISNSTIVYNTSGISGGGTGGGVYNSSGGVNIKNTIIANNIDILNHGPDIFGTITSYGYNLITTDQDANITYQGSDINGTDPLLNTLSFGASTYNHTLQSGSPAIDAGACTDLYNVTVTTDQDEISRPQGSTCDIGSIEYIPPPSTITLSSIDQASIVQAIADVADGGVIELDVSADTVISISTYIDIDKSVEIINVSNYKVTFDGLGSSRVFVIANTSEAKLNNIIIKNGYVVEGYGGAIINDGNLTIEKVVINSSTADIGIGGAIYNSTTGYLGILSSSLYENNATDAGGAIYNDGVLSILNSTISSNYAADGGGIYTQSGDVNISHSTIAFNLSGDQIIDVFATLSGPADVIEGDTATYTVNITQILDANVSFDLTETGISASLGTDYSTPTPNPVTIAIGSTSATFSMLTYDNAVTDSGNDYSVTISNPTGSYTDNVSLTTSSVTTLISDAGGGDCTTDANLCVDHIECSTYWDTGTCDSIFGPQEDCSTDANLCADNSECMIYWDSGTCDSLFPVASGGGIYNVSSTININNSIIMNNTDLQNHAPNIYGSINSYGNNIIGLTDAELNVTQVMGSDDINVSSSVIDVLDTNISLSIHGLLDNSIAIDASDCLDLSGNIITYDQNDILRPQGSSCDSGAVELFQPNSAPSIDTRLTNVDIDEDSAPSLIILSASDIEGDSFTFSATSYDTSKLLVSITADGNLTITPQANKFGVVNVDVNLTQDSDSLLSDSFTFSVTIHEINDAPIISGTPDTSVFQNSAYIFTPTVSDIENDTLTFNIVNKPTWADFNTTTGTLSGIPTSSDVGITSSIQISVADLIDTVSLASFSIEVISVSSVPVLEPISNISIEEDFTDLSITLIATDADGDAITYSATSSDNSIATVSIVDSQLVVTPVANAYGVINIEVNATSNGESVFQSFDINVTAVDDEAAISHIYNRVRRTGFSDF